MFFWSKPSLGLIGLDVQPQYISLVELQKCKLGLKPILLLRKEIKDSIYEDGKITKWGYLRSLLSQLTAEKNLQGRIVAIQLPSSMTHMQYLMLPQGLSDDEIIKEIQQQVARDLPGMHDNLWVDFEIQNETSDQYNEIFYVTTKSNYIKQLIDCIHAANLIVKVVDVDAFVLRRLARDLLARKKQHQLPSILIYADYPMLILIIFNRSAVFWRQHWNRDENNNYLDQLQLRILNAPLHTDNQQLILYSNDKNNDLETALKNRIDMDVQVFSMTNKFLNFKSDLDFSYLLSCGLAMRGLN